MRARSIATITTAALAVLLPTCSALAATNTNKPKSPVIAGALYRGDPFAGDAFTLRVSNNAHSAKLVGSFTYTDPGCPEEPFGNEFLTSRSVPKLTISANGRFEGAKTVQAGSTEITDTISGRFEGERASGKFTESETCPDDKPLVIKLKLKAK
ncbi:MAG: hypothetical protein ACRDJX_05385 [Solirubrobacteraceae bacterium]